MNTIYVYDVDTGMLALLCKSSAATTSSIIRRQQLFAPPLSHFTPPPPAAAVEHDDVDVSSKMEAAVADDLHSLRASLAGTL